MLCSKCGTLNAKAAIVCANCSYAFPPPHHAISMNHVKSSDFASEDEYYKAVIGARNQDYYLRHFSRFDNDGKTSATWHWPAFLGAFYWMLYRKMWLSAAIYCLLIFLIWSGSNALSGDQILLAGLLYLAVSMIWLPMYANALYYRHCKRTISSVRLTSPDATNQLSDLSEKGGTTSNTRLILVVAFTFVVFIVMMAVVALIVSLFTYSYSPQGF